MDSLGAKLAVNLYGYAQGTSTNANIKLKFGETGTTSLASTSTTSSQANEVFGYSLRSLALSTSETWDLRSYTNVLGETTKTLAEIRFLYIEHDITSTAVSITVGNAASNQLTPFSMSATNTFTLLPGEGFVMWAPSTTAIPCDGTHKSVKVLNNSGVAAAIYNIYAIGSIS